MARFTPAPASGSGGSSVDASETKPESPQEGDLWFNAETGVTYIYYDSSWVEA